MQQSRPPAPHRSVSQTVDVHPPAQHNPHKNYGFRGPHEVHKHTIRSMQQRAVNKERCSLPTCLTSAIWTLHTVDSTLSCAGDSQHLFAHPGSQLWDICNGVQHATWRQQVCVVGQLRPADDAPPVRRRLEVWVLHPFTWTVS